MKKFLKITGCVLSAIVLVIGGYFAYVMIDYHRIGSCELDVVHNGNVMRTDGEYKVFSWNIGFGAYENDYGFFMDGGTESWAWSEERLMENLEAIASVASEQNADICLFQEVDIDSTRSYHIDEREPLNAVFGGYSSVFCQNYDSPFLMYPLIKPHGASKAGLMTFSRFDIASADRTELPIETSLMKLVDLDRCYSVQRIPVDNERTLIVYDLHLSAYTSDGTIANEQLEILLNDMQTEYENGNYCIAGGDFNKDILGDSEKYFGKSDKEYTWAQPIPDEIFKNKNIKLIAPIDKERPTPSCRNADSAYHEGQYVLTIDGFMVSDNVNAVNADVIDLAFRFSDHNPVCMTFTFKK